MFSNEELKVIRSISAMALVQYEDSCGEIDYAAQNENSPVLLRSILEKSHEQSNPVVHEVENLARQLTVKELTNKVLLSIVKDLQNTLRDIERPATRDIFTYGLYLTKAWNGSKNDQDSVDCLNEAIYSILKKLHEVI